MLWESSENQFGRPKEKVDKIFDNFLIIPHLEQILDPKLLRVLLFWISQKSCQNIWVLGLKLQAKANWRSLCRLSRCCVLFLLIFHEDCVELSSSFSVKVFPQKIDVLNERSHQAIFLVSRQQNHSREPNFHRVVYDLFADHDDSQLSGHLHETVSVGTVLQPDIKYPPIVPRVPREPE